MSMNMADDTQALGREYFAFSLSYLDAANILVRSGNETTMGPFLNLMAHALELLLKAYLFEIGYTKKQLLAPKVRHDLSVLAKLCADEGLRLSRNERDAIGVIGAFHAAYEVRYPSARDDITAYPASDLVAFGEAFAHNISVGLVTRNPGYVLAVEARKRGEALKRPT